MSMRGHAMGGGRGGGWGGMRSMRQDRAVLQHRVKKGTARRMLTFAVPYRKILAVFVPVVILDAVDRRRQPPDPARHHRQRHPQAQRRPRHLAVRPGRRPGPRRRRPRRSPSAGSRPTSARASSTTCAPRCSATSSACRWPSSPGPRPARWSAGSTTTSSAPSRPSPTCSSNVVGNLVTVVIVLGAMFFLSWQITLAALILVPLFLIPARFVGQRIGSLTKEGYNLNSEMNMVMQERFQVGGAMLVKLFGRPEAEAHVLRGQGGPRPRHRHRPGHLLPRLLRRAHADRRPGHGPRLRLRRRGRRARRARTSAPWSP